MTLTFKLLDLLFLELEETTHTNGQTGAMRY